MPKLVISATDIRYLTNHLHLHAELQKRANRANQLLLFLLAGANFWEKQRFLGAKFFVGKIGRC